MKAALLVGLAASGAAADAGCALPSLELRWDETPSFDRSAADRFPEASVVVLEREHRFLMFVDGKHDLYSEQQVHEAFLVRTERGFGAALVRIPRTKKGKLLHFRARTVAPDGSVREVLREDLVADTATAADDEWEIESFRFPKVEVGSVLEVSLTVRSPGWYASIVRAIADDAPVVRYRMEIVASKTIRYAATAYQVPAARFEKEDLGDLYRISLELRDLDVPESEDRAPHWRRTSPWWLFRVPKLVFERLLSSLSFDIYRDWVDAMEDPIETLYDRGGDLHRGFDAAAGTSCATPAACIEEAVSKAREAAEWSGFEGDEDEEDWRSLDDVRDSGHAHQHEKARLLWGLLDARGLSPRYAVLARRTSGFIDRNHPAALWFDHAIVLVPAQPGVPADVWIDPSCEACGPGVLPPWTLGADALVLQARPTPAAAWKVAEGSPLRTSRVHTDYGVTFSPEGKLLVEAAVRSEGSEALLRRAKVRTWTRVDWEDDADRFATARSRAAASGPPQEADCDRARGECLQNHSFELPPAGGAGAATLVVPLAFFHTDWDGELEPRTRRRPIRFDFDEERIEEARIVPPQGYRLASAPAGGSWSASGLEVETSVRTEGGHVVVRRVLRARRGEWPATSYGEIRALCRRYDAWRLGAVVLERARLAMPGGFD